MGGEPRQQCPTNPNVLIYLDEATVLFQQNETEIKGWCISANSNFF